VEWWALERAPVRHRHRGDSESKGVIVANHVVAGA